MNPYHILHVPMTADDKEIREAYLQAIREFSPEKDPTRFQAVAQAYKKIADAPARYRYLLFNEESPGSSPLEAAYNQLAWQRPPLPMSFAAMKSFLSQCTSKLKIHD